MTDASKPYDSSHNDAKQSEPASSPVLPLRIWPPILLLVAMLAARLLPSFVEENGKEVFAIFAAGPALGALALFVWWLILSRATGRERVLGFLALVVFAIGGYMYSHVSMRPMGYVLHTLPSSIAAFTLAMIVLSQVRSTSRTWIGVVVGLIAFGTWTFVRNDGVTGDFQSSRSWTWQPTQEETFLASLNDRPQMEDGDAGVDQGTLDAFQNPEWPSFRGPHRDGVQPGITLNEDWTANPPKQLWQISIGPGWGSFVVAGNRLFTQEQRGDEEMVTCYDTETGAELWATGYESRFWESIAGAGPRATPTLANGNLFVLGAEGLLHRIDPATGAIVWMADIRKDADRSPPTWGFSASPLVVDNLVIVHAGGDEGRGVLAYDVEKAEIEWSAPSGNHSYSSAQLSQLGGRDQILMVSNSGVDGIDPADGALLWRHAAEYEGYRVLQPTVLDDETILVSTPIGEGTERIRIADSDQTASASEDDTLADSSVADTADANDSDSSGTDSSEASSDSASETLAFASESVWHTRSIKPSYNDFVVHDGYIYGFDHNIFVCVNVETGERQWKKGRYGNGQVLLLSDANQLLVLSEEGELILLRTNPEKHEELGKFQALDGKTWNHPVLIGKRLYLRNSEEAVALELQ